jgi:Asp-tRNA(Asn)/Glu-tRNA(Gln) amidotransferase A subunit family amidase
MIWRVLPVAVLDEMTNGRLYMAARREVISLQQRLQSVFDDVDLLLTPTLQRLPPAPDEITTSEDVFDMLGNTSVFNLTGNPGVAVPIGTAENLPVSAQIVGPHFEDGLALKGARLLERLGE